MKDGGVECQGFLMRDIGMNTCTVKMNDSDRDRNCMRESTIEEEGREELGIWKAVWKREWMESEEIDSTIQNGLHKQRIDRGSEWERMTISNHCDDYVDNIECNIPFSIVAQWMRGNEEVWMNIRLAREE